MELIINLILIALYLALTLLCLSIFLNIVGVSVFIGAIGGVAVGLFYGIRNYVTSFLASIGSED